MKQRSIEKKDEFSSMLCWTNEQEVALATD